MLTKTEERFFEKPLGYWITYMTAKVFATFFICALGAYLISFVVSVSLPIPNNRDIFAFALIPLIVFATTVFGTVALWHPTLFQNKNST